MRYCDTCGGKLDQRGQCPDCAANVNESAKKKKRKLLLLIILALVAVAALAICTLIIGMRIGAERSNTDADASSDKTKIAAAVPHNASTTATTEILNISIPKVTASTIEMKFVAEGTEPEEWLLSYCAEGETPKTKSFTGHSVILSGLDPDTNYELKLLDSGDVHLTGEVTVSGRTLPSVTLVPDSVVAKLENSTATITWEHEGDTPTSWTVTTTGNKGYEDVKTVTENELVLENLVAGETYTLVFTCDNMVSGVTASFTVDAYSIANIDTEFDENGDLVVSWCCQAQTENVEWVVVYSLDGNEDHSFRKSTTEQSIVLTDLFPGSAYTVEIKEANGEKVRGNNSTLVYVPGAEQFTDYGFTTIYPVMYLMPDKENWTLNDLVTSRTAFSSSERIAFVCNAASLQLNDDPVTTLLLVKNEAGQIVDFYTNASEGGASWKSMWINSTYVGELARTPSEPGRYTLELYFNNKRVRTTDDFTFTITE